MHRMATQPDDLLSLANELHRRVIVIDTHCDTTQRLGADDWDFAARHDTGHVDIPRLGEGGIGAVFLAVWAKGPLPPGDGAAAARRQIEAIQQATDRCARWISFARTADEIRAAKAGGKIAVLIGIEGGYLIENSLDILREYHRCGAAYLTLTHGFHTDWADSSGIHEPLPPRHGGLTPFGREVIAELNRLGMMVDVSHVSDAAFWDVVETSTVPIIASHSSCRAVAPHRRNLADDMMRAIAAAGGVVQINFAPAFIDSHYPDLDPEQVARWFADENANKPPLTEHLTSIDCVVDHFDHALRLIGPDHVGIGSDFDGVPALPSGLEDCSKLPHLTAALLRRGHSEADIIKVLGGNVLRVMEACRNR